MEGTIKVKGRKSKKGSKDQYPIGFRRKVAMDYINGDRSYRQLGLHYGLDSSTVYYWVKRYYSELSAIEPKAADMTESEHKELEALKKQNEELKKQLEYSEMKATAFEIMIDIAEKQLGVAIKKKPGTKQP